MFNLNEIRIQYKYLLRVAYQLGWSGGLRSRALAWLGSITGSRYLVRMHPACLQYPVMVRPGTTDADTYHQVLIEKQYSLVPNLAPDVIVDCGANVGYTSAYFLTRFPTARVIAIEPWAENAALCRRNLAPYGDRVTILEAAIWSGSGQLAIDVQAGYEWAATVRSPDALEPAGVTAISIVDLGLSHIDLLKIDIEGSEAILFRDGVENWLPRVGSIVIELHGQDCEIAFKEALSGYDYEWREQGELSMAAGLKRKDI